jgi:hypothetical protein
MTPVHHFLIVYDVTAQRLIDAADLGVDIDAALEAYRAREQEQEQEHRHDGNIEIVLIGADSLDTIKQTHPHYFDGAGEDFFATVLA